MPPATTRLDDVDADARTGNAARHHDATVFAAAAVGVAVYSLATLRSDLE